MTICTAAMEWDDPRRLWAVHVIRHRGREAGVRCMCERNLVRTWKWTFSQDHATRRGATSTEGGTRSDRSRRGRRRKPGKRSSTITESESCNGAVKLT
ncbi:MAG: hypothetical protein ABJN52_00630 [Litorimonas sp.]